MEYWCTILLRGDRIWQYAGTIHEQLIRDPNAGVTRMNGFTVHNHSEVTEAKLELYNRLLFEELAKNPDNAYLVFRIGMNFVGMKKFETAIRFFMMRTTMGGSEEEFYVSLFNIA